MRAPASIRWITACRRCWVMRSRSWSTVNSRGTHERLHQTDRAGARPDARPRSAAGPSLRGVDRRAAGLPLVGAPELHAAVLRDGRASGRRLASPHARAGRDYRHQVGCLSRGHGARAAGLHLHYRRWRQHRSRDAGDGDLRRSRRPHAADSAAHRVRNRHRASQPPGRLDQRPGAAGDFHRHGRRGGMSKTRSARLHDVLAAHVSRGDMPGLVALVSRRGETQVEAIGRQSFESDVAMRRDTIFRIASMSKPITAAATLILVEQCKLRLDDPVDAFLPELADRRVLKSLEGPVDDTVPARRPITARDLLTFTFGMGAVMVFPPKYPIQKAAADAGLAPGGPFQPTLTPDEFMKRLGALPLIYQPGERWLYHTGADVLGVLIARASGQSFEAFLQDRLFGPLGMRA